MNCVVLLVSPRTEGRNKPVCIRNDRVCLYYYYHWDHGFTTTRAYFSRSGFGNTDKVGCVLSLAVVDQSRLTWVSEKPSICIMQPRLTFPSSLRELSFQALTLSLGTRFVAWFIRCSSRGEYRQRAGHFGNPGCVRVTVLRLDTPYKRPCVALTL